MGNLVVKQVKYNGDLYRYESPILSNGINVVVGDNGSGKSTFSYFIEFALGGTIRPFVNDGKGDKYIEILEDTNNYVELTILINDDEYTLKRFIGFNQIFYTENNEIKVLPLTRDKDTAPVIFSDWLLEKLNIPQFELNLGTMTWIFNFIDLFRLLNYDQDTEAKKIYKAPKADNFISDSGIIRKAIFEILLGISSAEYFKAADVLKAAIRARDVAKGLLESFNERYGAEIKDKNVLQLEITDLQTQITKLEQSREIYLKSNTTVDDRLGELAGLQNEIVELELKISRVTINIKNYEEELNKVAKLYENQVSEIGQIQKIIFTHEKLDLFSMEICPFCMTDKGNRPEGYCICGSKYSDDDYEKFVYNASEYKDILQHKQKSINAVKFAEESYEEEISELKKLLELETAKSIAVKEKLEAIVRTAEFAGNTTMIESLNRKIIELRDQVHGLNGVLDISKEARALEDSYNSKKIAHSNAYRNFITAKAKFEENNVNTIIEFNRIYGQLLSESSYKSESAYIDEDYMPVINDSAYKAKSFDVPRRLMYYLTILSLSLKFDSVKHPRFLLIDTPEGSGIDIDNLKLNLELLETAIALSKDNPNDEPRDFQVILTTGYGKLPDDFEKYVVEKFNTSEGKFILELK
ncbi:AAA family ATPase [Pedobacter frigoris]|uniref:Rad50/SbcC-type AAA domain-containing protein n=1 Tax=Pedobacter frigoris TaxID=2571272 RepID=A0A4U1CJ18_9SPHI|nr:AAA family ATPase [Pedobacter frigoris]TKC06939.1 hypothetical protein FA047_06620 [Pedobacter frigoris]